MPDIATIIDALEQEAPTLHTWEGKPGRWGFERPGLELLDRLVKPGDATLETGGGHSTILFAAKGARHTCIMPDEYTHQEILKWCAAHEINTSNVTFVVDCSQHVLPNLKTEPLDLILIDGEHAFPLPYLDWYYTEPMLKVGGKLLVDDVQLRSCAILRSFLALQPQWRFESDVANNLAVFTKLHNGSTMPGWSGQVAFNPDHPNYPSLDSETHSFVEIFGDEARESYELRRQLEQELAAIKASTLWRASRPIVDLFDRLKRNQPSG